MDSRHSPSVIPSPVWVPPSASSGSRPARLKHSISVCGSFIDDASHREIVFESTLERDLAYILLVDPSVASLRDQPKAVSYVDDHGVRRRHTFDFIVTLVDGRRIAIAVKPEKRVQASGIVRILELISSQPGSRRIADSFVLRTDRQICRDRAADARLVFRARRTRDADAVATVEAFVDTLRGRLSIQAITEALPDVPHVFMRIVNLIDEGRLTRSGRGRLSVSSLVSPVSPVLSAGGE